MNIFKVNWKECEGYDVYEAFVVVAETGIQAREMCAKRDDSDPYEYIASIGQVKKRKVDQIWMEKAELTDLGKYTGVEEEPFIVLISYWAG